MTSTQRVWISQQAVPVSDPRCTRRHRRRVAVQPQGPDRHRQRRPPRRAYLDSEYTRSAAERERIFGLLLQERDQILSLGPKYRQMVRDEPALMQLLDHAAAKHDEAVDRGEAEPFTRKGLTS